LEYVVYALKSLKESSLLKAALLVLNSIVREAKTNFSQYSNEIIPLLIEILTNNDVSRNNKLIAITNIGEISLNICEAFLPYLDPVMKLLFSAAQLAITQADSVNINLFKFFFVKFFLYNNNYINNNFRMMKKQKNI